MTVIADFEFPAEHFVLSETIGVPNVEIEIERLVAHVHDGLTPYFRITAEDFDVVERSLADDPTVTDVQVLERFEDERFYRVHWTDTSGGLTAMLQETEAPIVSATCHDGRWEVRSMFADRETLSSFFEHCHDELGFGVELVRVFDRSNPATYGEYGLTREQRDALLAALEAGYYDVPKETHVDGLADELDISPQAVSQRLRRGCKNLLANTIGTHEADEAYEHV